MTDGCHHRRSLTFTAKTVQRMSVIILLLITVSQPAAFGTETPLGRMTTDRRADLVDACLRAGLIDDAFISLLMHDNDRAPIDASPRRRYPTRRQKGVLDARQPECAEPGCTARALLQYDHIVPYPKGGPTVLANLQRLCGPHNRQKGG